jgi:hypothetical protein
MSVETIGEAYMLGWRIHARCAWGRREAMKSVRGCQGKAELDLHNPGLDEGRCFPDHQPGEPAKMPALRSRRVSIMFDLPKEPNATRIRACRADRPL